MHLSTVNKVKVFVILRLDVVKLVKQFQVFPHRKCFECGHTASGSLSIFRLRFSQRSLSPVNPAGKLGKSEPGGRSTEARTWGSLLMNRGQVPALKVKGRGAGEVI